MATVTSYTSAHIDALLAGKVDPATLTASLATKADLVSGKVPDTQIGSNVVRIDSLVLNVQNHGAVGDGVTDDTTAIQAVLNTAPAGSTVYLPKSYAVTSPLKIPPQVRLLGQHGSHVTAASLPTIKAKSTFTGTGVIVMNDQATGGSGGAYALLSTDQCIENLTIDMSAIPGATYVYGIYALGYVYGVRLKDVGIYNPTGYGVFNASNGSGIASGWHATRVNVISPRDHGMNATMSDSTWIDCLVYGGSFNGWQVGAAQNSLFDTCRAERNAGSGFVLASGTGTGAGSGGPTFIGCTTDRNGQNGVQITGAATGNGPVTFIGCSFRRDGYLSTSAGYAGININGAAEPIIITGCKSYPGVDDAGTGNATPQYGISATSSNVQVEGGIWHAISEGVHDGGSNTRLARSLNVSERTGTTSSPVTVTRGVQTNGINGTSLDVPGNLAGIPTPSDHSAIAWVCDPAQTTNGTTLANGYVYLAAIYVQKSITATKLFWGSSAAGNTPVAGQNWIGLYDSAGNRLAAVAADSRVAAAAAVYTETINVSLTPGFYWVGWLFNASTSPSVCRTNTPTTAVANFNQTATTYRFCVNGAGAFTNLPSPLVVANNSATFNCFWAALG
jgi:hypothetical protein